jgi:predicted alpha/beta superfamily hydrolase
MLIRLSALATVFMLAFPVMAAEPSRKFVLDNTEISPLKSRHTGASHEVVIVFPESYGKEPKRTYPVFYYLDAYWDTPLLVSTYGNLRYDNQIPEILMVGLSYPSGDNYGVRRRQDYTPTAMDAKSGGADKFLAFIRDEVAPLVEKNYRGEKTDRVLGGVSLGGLFTLYAAYNQPDFFSGYIAISPAASWDKQVLFKVDDGFAKKHSTLPARMFISYGSAEYAPFRLPIEQMQKRLEQRSYKNMALLNYVMEGLDHTAVKGDGYVRGLTWVLQPKKPAGPAGLERDMKAAGE